MPSCSHCSGNRPISTDEQLINSPDGTRKKRRRLFTSCSACGRVLRDRSLRSLDKALASIQDIATNALHLNPNAAAASSSSASAADESTSDSVIINDAQDLVRKAMAKEEEELFGLGRHTRTHVAAACLYISLRRHRKPYMLIDLSDYLRVTVYVLGAMFVALCRILGIKEDFKEEEVEDLYSNSSSSSSCFVIDPSLFMHRISTRLLGRKDAEVASMALRILSRTNQKQRGWMLTKQKQIPIRRICTAALYIAASTAYAEEEEEEEGRVHKFSKLVVAMAVRSEFKTMESGDGLTMDEFVSRAAGMTTSSSDGGGGGGVRELVCQHKKSSRPHCRYGLCKECYHVFVTIAGDILEHSAEPPPYRPTARTSKIRREGEVVKALESLSDVEDYYDISENLNTEPEKRYKTMIWELMNKEYLEEKKSNDAAAADATGNKPKKERKKQRRVGGSAVSEETLSEKRVSSRINYDVLAQLNGEAKQQLEGVVGSEENNEEGHFDMVEEAMEEEEEDEEAEAGIDGDGKSATAGDDYYGGDLEEDYGGDGGGGYNEYYCDDDFAGDDDFGL